MHIHSMVCSTSGKLSPIFKSNGLPLRVISPLNLSHTLTSGFYYSIADSFVTFNDDHSTRDAHKASTSQASIIIRDNQLLISCTFRDTYYCQVPILSSIILVTVNRSLGYFCRMATKDILASKSCSFGQFPLL